MSLRFSPERVNLRVEIEAVYGVDETVCLTPENRRIMRDRASFRALGVLFNASQHEAIEAFIQRKKEMDPKQAYVMEAVLDASCLIGVQGGSVFELYQKDRFDYSQIAYPTNGVWENDLIEEAHPRSLAVLTHSEAITH